MRFAPLALLGCSFGAAAQPSLEWLDRDAIAAREVQVNIVRSDQPLTAEIQVAVEVDAPATAIWDVLKACESSPEYVPNVQSCTKLEELDGGEAHGSARPDGER